MSLKTQFLATLTIEVAENHVLGETPAGFRRIAVFAGGSFVGPRINAVIASGGSDAVLRRHDQAVQPDVRMTLKTDDGAFVFVTYRGLRHGPAEVMERIARNEDVRPDEYYQRNAMFFETAAPNYDWLNRIIAVGTSRRVPGKMIYEVYEVL